MNSHVFDVKIGLNLFLTRMSLSKGDEKQMRKLLKTDEKKIDLFTQITDINIDHIGESIVVEISVNDLPESGLPFPSLLATI